MSTLPGIVSNDDFATTATNLPSLLRQHRPAWFCTQESKGIGGYASRLTSDHRTDDYRVRQDMRTEGTQGVSVGWDTTRLRAIVGAHRHGWHFLVDGKDLEPRGVVWQDVELVQGKVMGRLRPKRFRLSSAHRPPIRDRHLWPRFDHALRQWIAQSPYPVLTGMDSNQEGGPLNTLTGRIGKRLVDWHGHRIDGVLTDLRVGSVRDLAKGSSDHHPLLVTVSL